MLDTYLTALQGENLLKIFPSKPTVLFSSCLLGMPVRYDGEDKHLSLLSDEILPWVEAVNHCPEVASGMGVPRPPIQLVASSRGVRVKRVEQPNVDMTDDLKASNFNWLEDQHKSKVPVAAILKARSPSCGSNDTPLHNSEGEPFALTDGVFVHFLRQQYPSLVILNEEFFSNREACSKFIFGCYLQQASLNGTLLPSQAEHWGWKEKGGLTAFLNG